jgi:anti-sigma B factor antagonist
MTDGTLLDVVVSHPADDQHLVELRGELDFETASSLTDRLVDIAGSMVVLDLSGLRFIDARGLSALLEARGRIEAQGHGIEFCRARGIVRRVFELCGLDDLLSD